jgi:hypothetical protein
MGYILALERKARKVKEAPCIKIISQDQQDFPEIVRLLESDYAVIATSRPILDSESDRWHIFLNLMKKPQPIVMAPARSMRKGKEK